MCRNELPRVYELLDLIQDPNQAGAYFKDFDNSIRDEPSKKRVWLEREQTFQKLDSDAWEFLIDKAKRYLSVNDSNGRGWHQLVDILNEAYAYRFLKDNGYTNVEFIPESSLKSPELKAEKNGCKVLCEVKTINISDDEAFAREEARRRREGTATAITDPITGRPDPKIINKLARIIEDQLDAGFFSKLMSKIEHAKRQMEAYADGTNVKRIVYIIISFDDFLGEYKKQYYLQIDQYLAKNLPPGIEVVFHNQRTPIHEPITMTSATVING